MTNDDSDQTLDESDMLEHEKVLRRAGFDEEDTIELLNIVNGLITAGIKLGNSLEYKSLDMMEDFGEKWDLINKKKLPYVKRLASFITFHDKASQERKQ